VCCFLHCAACTVLCFGYTLNCPLLQEMKLRLISIFIITQKGITDSEKEELFLAAQLSASERQVQSQIILSYTRTSVVCTVIKMF
jgi:hypothetical protein